MNILFLSRWFPYPPDNGSKIRAFNLLKSLAGEHCVTLLSFVSEPPDPAQLAEMRQLCPKVQTVVYRPFNPGRARALLGFFSRRPRSVVDTFNQEMQTLVTQAVAQTQFDLVIASELDMAPYAVSVPRLPRILEELELTTLFEQYSLETRPLKKFLAGLRWWKLTGYIAKLMGMFNAVTVVSEPERQRLQKIAPGAVIEVIPNGVDTTYNTPGLAQPQPNTLVYSGALTYNANFDAVDFFLRDVFPGIRQQQPAAQLFVTGKVDGVPIERLPQAQNVTFTGYLNDIRPKIAASWVNVVPLRMGGGTRLKILESLALGTPVVSTRKGAEGLNLEPERDILLADTPADFAGAVLRLLVDSSLRQRLSSAGRQTVESRYGWSQIGHQFTEFVNRVAAHF